MVLLFALTAFYMFFFLILPLEVAVDPMFHSLFHSAFYSATYSRCFAAATLKCVEMKIDLRKICILLSLTNASFVVLYVISISFESDSLL